MKSYNIKRESLFNLITKFPNLNFSHLGTLFVSAWITDEEAIKINLEFPNVIFKN